MATILTIPTYDGSGEAVHPDVIKVGDLYVMAFTPYEASDNQIENPSIVTSSDGTTWAVPDGLTNPIVASPSGSGFNSDTEIVYDSGTYYLFYRENTGVGTVDEKIYVRTSTDLVTWSSATTLLSASNRSDFLSPAVVKDGPTWKMWVVNATANPNTLDLYTASSPTGSWTKAATCTLPSSSDDIWHVDVVAHMGGFIALLNYCDIGQSGDNGYLRTAISNDGLTWRLHDIGIDPGGTIERTYRGALLYDDGDWRCWYSQRTTGNEWQVLLEEDPPMVALHATPSALAGAPSAWPSLKP